MKNPKLLFYILLLISPFQIFGQTVNTLPVNLVGSSDPMPGPGGFFDHPFTPSPLTGTYHGGVFYGATKEKWGYEISDLTVGEEYVLTVYYMYDRVIGTPAYDRHGNLSMLSGAALDITTIPYVPEPEWRDWFSMEVTFTAISATDRIDIEADGITDNSLWLWTDMAIDGGGACDDMLTTVSATEVCLGEEVTLEATSTHGGTITWDGGVTNGVAFVPPVGVTTYTATSDSDDDCDFSVEITVYDLPVVSGTADATEICLGDEVILTGSGAVTYVWDGGVTDGVAHEPLTAGINTFTVTGTDANGCENTATVDVDVLAPPAIDAGEDVEVCEGGAV
uniref:hypothetical protein n=1 Tax=Crocinitomix algicola TaxID=1740263 RepID=UPI001112EDB3